MDNYGVKDIKTLEGIEAIRLRPGSEIKISVYQFRPGIDAEWKIDFYQFL